MAAPGTEHANDKAEQGQRKGAAKHDGGAVEPVSAAVEERGNQRTPVNTHLREDAFMRYPPTVTASGAPGVPQLGAVHVDRSVLL